jgi:hypothetical protein
MNKNNKQLLLFLLLAVSLIVLAACSKSECKTTSDCASRACAVSRCSEAKCIYTVQTNCCGNGLKESFEDGKPGDKCSCPQDYGKCEGIPKVNVRSRELDATYATYYCNQFNRCVMGSNPSDASLQTFLDNIYDEYFEASSVMQYNKPFDMRRDTFEVKFTVDDVNDNLVMPVTLTGIRILYVGATSRSEQLIADKEVNAAITKVGGSASLSVPLNLGYKPQEVEETGSFRYVIDYTYTKNIQKGRDSSGNPVYEAEFTRNKYNSPSKQVILVRSE